MGNKCPSCPKCPICPPDISGLKINDPEVLKVIASIKKSFCNDQSIQLYITMLSNVTISFGFVPDNEMYFIDLEKSNIIIDEKQNNSTIILKSLTDYINKTPVNEMSKEQIQTSNNIIIDLITILINTNTVNNKINIQKIVNDVLNILKSICPQISSKSNFGGMSNNCCYITIAIIIAIIIWYFNKKKPTSFGRRYR
jgi:hypothetical protein